MVQSRKEGTMLEYFGDERVYVLLERQINANCAASIIFADVLPHRKPILDFYRSMVVVTSPF
jgi:hypothetical protein